MKIRLDTTEDFETIGWIHDIRASTAFVYGESSFGRNAKPENNVVWGTQAASVRRVVEDGVGPVSSRVCT